MGEKIRQKNHSRCKNCQRNDSHSVIHSYHSQRSCSSYHSNIKRIFLVVITSVFINIVVCSCSFKRKACIRTCVFHILPRALSLWIVPSSFKGRRLFEKTNRK